MAAGRKTKYDDAIVAKILELLRGGCIIADICARVGINQDTYFTWVKRYPEFSEKVDRAKGEANTNATLAMRKAMMPHDVTSRTTKTISETKLRKAKDKETGQIVEVPYTYTKTEQSETLSNEFDWRAALEFLKRRDPDNWSETFIIRVTPDQANLLKGKGVTASELWEQMMQELANDAAEH